MYLYYSKEFKEKVLKSLENNNSKEYLRILKKFLESGEPVVGRFLEDAICLFQPNDIIEAYENGQMEKLYLEAKRMKAIEKVYREWKELEAKGPISEKRSRR